MKNLIRRILKEETIKRFLTELDALNIPREDYVIFGSGPMAIKGLLEPADLDVVVRENVYKEMFGDKEPIRIGNIELSYTWPKIKTEEIFKNINWVQGYPFADIKLVRHYKKEMNREKDITDLKLLNPE
jgi:hypothetical protein